VSFDAVRRLARAPREQQERALHAVLMENPDVRATLGWAAERGLPSWYLGAGGVVQTVWNRAHGFPPTHAIKDYDLVYFDPDDLSEATEHHYEADAREALGVPVDVTNEARVHLWYAERFGRAIQPYRSVEEAIATWPTTASSIGVRLELEDLKVCAPFGLRDLFSLVVRPNKAIVPRAVYEEKAARWLASWPRLSVEAW
jgi:hypothetical protein